MKTSDFYYELPKELIAQTPLKDRSASRLMVLDKESGAVEHKHFTDIVDLLNEGDALILNDTKVLPARLYGVKEDTGGTIEFLLLHRKGIDVWEVILRPGRRAKPGARFVFGNGELKAEILETLNEGNRLVKFTYDGVFEEVLDRLGEMPVPPYITEKLRDKNRYQTVYAKHPGSAAAPTAGLHFTPELLEKIKDKGVNIGFLTLHVGLGTFRPVKAEDISEHKMHSEFYILPQGTAELVNKTKAAGKRVISVGTTATRVLETAGADGLPLKEQTGWTNIFIYPGRKFNVIDALITNFHLPESTLIMLVSALAGRENVLNAYNEAVKERYRFFSFGDAMFIK
ncbi:MAG TPA: tRNA preQ1(34) S-adenosylmethionine ribosyltransferase-isomerase QueA [Candidatus Ornithomonoglobus intestinigallinarum]|uniref:S-adenosylmethionine:tRNA ribosyltransferase-isomerase n=1 Tax=Candidatus Ornithomonoglobus intestinigallinarum TaxID=2840894 RepID=A0A9D1H454_9FIRM|nr:tRNA preQ1(34) S-adenosylmethionine ribosyltransferase-isomerase QueA [Candidatus Ornithomonoglobus intestinigallinarum]